MRRNLLSLTKKGNKNGGGNAAQCCGNERDNASIFSSFLLFIF